MVLRFSLILILSFLCQPLRAEKAPLWIDSNVMTIVEAVIDEGYLYSHTKDEPTIRSLILRQLHFSIGQLNAIAAAPALASSLQIQIQNIQPTEEGYDVFYKTSFLIGWDKTNDFPNVFELILPMRADTLGINVFHETYVKDCGLPFEEGPETFFFYFRPDLPNCPIKSEPDPYLVVRSEMHLTKPSLPTPATTPRYDRVWANGKLSATFYFEKTDPNFPSGAEELYSKLLEQYGKPFFYRRLQRGYYHYVRAMFRTSSQYLDVSIFDVREGNILTITRDFWRLLRRRLWFTDLIVYNGHSGYGKKVRRFTELVAGFSKNPYKLIYLNGCDTFSYVDHTLFRSRTQMDIITTGLAGFFSFMPIYSMELIQSLLDKKDTYQEILEKISNGSPLLLGRNY